MSINKIREFIKNMSTNKIREFARALFTIIFPFLALITITYQVLYFGLVLIEMLYNSISYPYTTLIRRPNEHIVNLVISFFIVCLYFYISIREDMNKNRKP